MGLFSQMIVFSRKLRDSRYGGKLHKVIKATGITIAVTRLHNRIIAHNNERNPTEEMIKSLQFFKENEERINNVLNLLADEESKDVLKRMIQFRCFSRYYELPHNSISSQYFINNFFRYGEKEVFIDGGAYVGDTVTEFKKVMKKKKLKPKEIIAYEPDKENYNKLIHKHPDVLGIQAGLWKENGILNFKGNDVGGFFINAENALLNEDSTNVEVRSIDSQAECQNATFIKMDIEGSEYNALIGAKKVICTNKPKLAICIYHSDEDMLRIIELIFSMVPEYHFYIRQHCNSRAETVLYCQVQI